MATQLISEKYRDRIWGVLNCYDRLVFTGTLPQLCYPDGMSAYLKARQIRIFDYPKMFAEPLRDEIRANAEALAKEHGIEFIRKVDAFRKEKRIKQILKQRGDHPGLVHIFSAMEFCTAYYPWYDKHTGTTTLKRRDGKCLHYYFYFIDEELGLCYLRVPTWCPFRLQFYCNGHAWLGAQLRRAGVGFTLVDNAFMVLEDVATANRLAERLKIERLHRVLDRYAQQYCPIIKRLSVAYHWSIMQAEYATDILFKRPEDLQAFYPLLLETLIHSVKPENIATFLGQKLHGNYGGEIGSRLTKRAELTRIKHTMGPVSIKMYDKGRCVLRIEVTVNNVSFFKEYRDVHRRTGEREPTWTSMRKTIYSLRSLQNVLKAATHRYLEFISQMAVPEIGVSVLKRITESKMDSHHSYKGFNPLREDDACLLRLLARGEFSITGLTSRILQTLMPQKTRGQISRILRRLRAHGLLKKIGRTYKYYLTALGKQIVAMALKLRELFVIPYLASAPAQ